ncbi:hypothetical protein LINPERHAP1_LOCUS9741 [Linum perenne]
MDPTLSILPNPRTRRYRDPIADRAPLPAVPGGDIRQNSPQQIDLRIKTASYESCPLLSPASRTNLLRRLGADLNSMIASSFRLVTLTLSSIKGIHKLTIRNNPNLKLLQANSIKIESLEIEEGKSLETLRLFNCEIDDLRISSTPNLKSLQIKTRDPLINKLISIIPSLESIMSTNPRIVTTVSCCCNVVGLEMKKLLANLRSRFQVTLELCRETPSELFRDHVKESVRKEIFGDDRRVVHTIHLRIPGGRIAKWTAIPAVECVKFPLHLLVTCNQDAALDNLFAICRPKFLHIINEPDHKNEDALAAAASGNLFKVCCPRFEESDHKNSWEALKEHICKKLMEPVERCGAACTCKWWRCQLRDAKMVTRMTNPITGEDEVVDVSTSTLPSVDDQICFRLMWH